MMGIQTFTVRSRQDRLISKLVRSNCVHSVIKCPIVFEDGFAPPRRVGESFHYETRGGRRVYHPTAYAKKGWSNIVYVHSTLRVIVGAGWVIEKLLEEERSRKTWLEVRRFWWHGVVRGAHVDGGSTTKYRFTSEGGIEPLSAN